MDALLSHNETPDISYNISINDDNIVNLNTDNYKPVVAGTITFNLSTQDGEVQKLVSKLYLTDIQTLPTTISSYITTILGTIVIILLVLIILLINIKTSTKTTNINKISRKSRRI